MSVYGLDFIFSLFVLFSEFSRYYIVFFMIFYYGMSWNCNIRLRMIVGGFFDQSQVGSSILDNGVLLFENKISNLLQVKYFEIFVFLFQRDRELFKNMMKIILGFQFFIEWFSNIESFELVCFVSQGLFKLQREINCLEEIIIN